MRADGHRVLTLMTPQVVATVGMKVPICCCTHMGGLMAVFHIFQCLRLILMSVDI